MSSHRKRAQHYYPDLPLARRVQVQPDPASPIPDATSTTAVRGTSESLALPAGRPESQEWTATRNESCDQRYVQIRQGELLSNLGSLDTERGHYANAIHRQQQHPQQQQWQHPAFPALSESLVISHSPSYPVLLHRTPDHNLTSPSLGGGQPSVPQDLGSSQQLFWVLPTPSPIMNTQRVEDLTRPMPSAMSASNNTPPLVVMQIQPSATTAPRHVITNPTSTSGPLLLQPQNASQQLWLQAPQVQGPLSSYLTIPRHAVPSPPNLTSQNAGALSSLLCYSHPYQYHQLPSRSRQILIIPPGNPLLPLVSDGTLVIHDLIHQREQQPPRQDSQNETTTNQRTKRKYDHESFPEKLHRLLIDAERERRTHWACFTPDGLKFQILDIEGFEKQVLPHYFRHSSIHSFKRLLRMYGFRRVHGVWTKGTFEHLLFRRDAPELCKQMERNG